jgi:hypothetical protein
MKRDTSDLLVRSKAKSYRGLCYVRKRMAKLKNSTPGERLKAAREAAGYASAAKAARALKMHYQNWIDHEAGRRGIAEQHAREYGRKLGVSWVYLLTGHEPDKGRTVPLMGLIGAGAEIFPIDAESIDFIEAPPGSAEGDVAFIIRGASMSPFNDGGTIVARPTAVISEALYRLAAVELEDGRRFFKKVMPGTRHGHFTLASLLPGTAPITDVRIVSAAKFKVYVEPE